MFMSLLELHGGNTVIYINYNTEISSRHLNS